MSRWTKVKEAEWSPGLWGFYYRDVSYAPGDEMWLYVDRNLRAGGMVGVCRFYDDQRDRWIPSELVSDAIELLQRYWSYQYSPLEQLAQQAE